jgi:proprotein convertase subtilisin/kexin type 1
LIVWTSEVDPVVDNPGWQQNAAGFWFNTRFGFGLMNAFGLVKTAINWTTVPEKTICTVTTSYQINETIAFGTPTTVQIPTTGCSGTTNQLRYLEHVELTTTISYPVRGALEVYLKSPSGSNVQMLAPRKLDKSRNGFQSWSFMSVMTWGETAEGVWTITILDNVSGYSSLLRA